MPCKTRIGGHSTQILKLNTFAQLMANIAFGAHEFSIEAKMVDIL